MKRTKEECIEYIVDYVAVGAKFIEEDNEGYIIDCFDDYGFDKTVKVFKDKTIKISDYKVLNIHSCKDFPNEICIPCCNNALK